MTEDQIKHLVDRFLQWRLPNDFNPDGGIRYERRAVAGPVDPGMPVGTNLLDAGQATDMVRFMIEGMPSTPAPRGMSDKEAVDMMQRCREDIVTLRATIAGLRPKADAYDSVAQILALLPRQGIAMGEDVVWTLNKRIRELTEVREQSNG